MENNKDIKLKDVAKLANVSPSTVSRVINEKTIVSEKTRKKVLKAISELSYVPNALAQNLRSQRTNTIGVIVSDIRVNYYAEIIKGIQNRAYSEKYRVIICDTENDKEKEEEYLKLLLDRSVDGLILVTSKLSDTEIIDIAEKGYSVGVIGRNINHNEILDVSTNNMDVAKQAVEHLINQGNEGVAFLSGYSHSNDNYDRLEGYIKALKANGIPFKPELVEVGNFSEDGGYEAISKLFKKDVPFSAVFCANDEMALGVYRACREHNLNIPKDLSVVGVDNIRTSHYLQPPLSTIYQPNYDMGGILARKMIEKMQNKVPTKVDETLLESKLLIRGSSLKSSESN